MPPMQISQNHEKLKQIFNQNKKHMKQEKFEYDTFFHVYNRGNNEENIFKEEKRRKKPTIHINLKMTDGWVSQELSQSATMRGC